MDTLRWRKVSISAGYADAGRGVGLADLTHAIGTDRLHGASREVVLYTLEIMDAMLRSGSEHRGIELTSIVARLVSVPFESTSTAQSCECLPMYRAHRYVQLAATRTRPGWPG